MAEAELSPWPLQDGYVHPGARLKLAIEAQYEHTGPIVPLEPEERAEHERRDVAASPDEPLANVYTNPKERTVTLLLDERTAAAVIYAARLMCADYEAHARELRVLAERFPSESYGQQNRITSAVRHERIARRLRAVEGAYRETVDEEFYGI